MNRISETFQKLQQQKKPAIVPYVTPEFPLKGTTVPLLLALERAGAAMIEIGIPFSDPLADGPTIQHSSEIALRNGATVLRVLELVKEARAQTAIPIILMGYFNPILYFGVEKFLTEAHHSGVDGLIIPDLPPEESKEFRELSKKYGVSNVFLIAPTSSEERIRVIDALSTDFTYCVSVTGVTGSRSSFGNHFDEFLHRVKRNTKKPFVVGFGIKGKEQVTMISSIADGVVVGSALLQAMENATSVDEAVSLGKNFLSSLQ
ncbi:MAG: tryptophan synthase subunit alpha [Bacteroidota bacterium]|nr:tryptophan synthase subunit alpha [Bacteroidota bacterium]